MQFRSPSLITLTSLLIIAVSGAFLWRGQSLQSWVVEDTKARKSRDIAFAAKLLEHNSPDKYYDAISKSHRNTLVLIVSSKNKAIAASNEDFISNEIVPDDVEISALKMGDRLNDILFTSKGQQYHLISEDINSEYEIYFITNISKILKDNWFGSFVQLGFIWFLVVGVISGFAVMIIVPVRRKKTAYETGQTVNIANWWPSEMRISSAAYNNLIITKRDFDKSLRHDVRTASGVVAKTARDIGASEVVDLFNEYQSKKWKVLEQSAILTCKLVEEIGKIGEPLKLEKQSLRNLEKDLMALYATALRVQWGEFEDILLEYDRPAIVSKVMCNLINNALTYAGEDATVSVGSKWRKGILTVFVADNGKPLTDDQIKKIMTRYGQSARLHPEIQGSGTGLFSARKTLEGHGWKLECKAIPNGGNIFYFEVK